MSEQINKVLADRPQNFSTAGQAQARTNIGAMAASASSLFQPAGNYLSASDASAFYPSTSNPSGYLVASSVSGKMDTSGMSAYIPFSSSSLFQPAGNYLSASEASAFYPSTANPSGYLVASSVSGKMDTSAMSAYVPFSAVSADANSAITSINGSSVGAGFSGVTTDSNLTGDGAGSALGISTSVLLTSNEYSARYQYNQLQFGDSSGHSGTLSREGLKIRQDGSHNVTLNNDGLAIEGSVDLRLTNTSNAFGPSGLYIREVNGAGGTATIDSNNLRMVIRGYSGSPLESYSSHVAGMNGSSLSMTYYKSDGTSKESSYLTPSSLKFSANDTSNTSYLPTATYARSGTQMYWYDAGIGHSTQLDITYSGIKINASSNYHITDIGPSSIVMRNAWSPATNSSMHDCYGSRWSSTAGDWCYVDPRRVYFGTGNEVSAQYIDNAKVKSYDAVNKLMSSLSAWATAQGWSPN